MRLSLIHTGAYHNSVQLKPPNLGITPYGKVEVHKNTSRILHTAMQTSRVSWYVAACSSMLRWADLADFLRNMSHFLGGVPLRQFHVANNRGREGEAEGEGEEKGEEKGEGKGGGGSVITSSDYIQCARNSRAERGELMSTVEKAKGWPSCAQGGVRGGPQM